MRAKEGTWQVLLDGMEVDLSRGRCDTHSLAVYNNQRHKTAGGRRVGQISLYQIFQLRHKKLR